MTKSSVDRKRSRYGEKYSLRFHKQLKIYHLTCNDEIPSLIAKFVETDGDLAMKLFERLENNYEENEQLKQFKEKVFALIDEKIKHYEHKPFSAPVGQPMSVNFDADVDRLARLSELQDLEKELKE